MTSQVNIFRYFSTPPHSLQKMLWDKEKKSDKSEIKWDEKNVKNVLRKSNTQPRAQVEYSWRTNILDLRKYKIVHLIVISDSSRPSSASQWVRITHRLQAENTLESGWCREELPGIRWGESKRKRFIDLSKRIEQFNQQRIDECKYIIHFFFISNRKACNATC